MTTVLATRPRLLNSLTGASAVTLGLAIAAAIVAFGARSPRDVVLFLLGGLLAGIAAANARAGIAICVATFMFWALVRRLLPASTASVDPAAIVPYLVSVPLAGRGLSARKPVLVVALLVWVTISASASFAQPLVGVAGWCNLALPLLAAFGIRDIAGGQSVLTRSVVSFGAVAATYGILQYFVHFQWDVRWLERSNFVSVGQFGHPTFHPFGTHPGPGTAALISALVILLVAYDRSYRASRLMRVWALASCTTFVLLAQVRSVWIALVLALLAGFLATAGRSLVRVGACIAIALAVLTLAPQGQVIATRARTLANLEGDASFRGRLNFLGGASGLASPFGTGLGSRSSASRVEEDRSIDNGYLVVLAETGVVGLGLLCGVLASAGWRARRPDGVFLAFLLVANLAGFAMSGLAGLVLWANCGAMRPAATKNLAHAGRDRAS